jgi:hypothetical protein
MNTPPKPTAEQVNAHASITFEGRTLHAACYPQMGGYGGYCWIGKDGSGCFDVWIWHDGEFPFGGHPGDRGPIELHHCAAEQFVEFGTWVMGLEPVDVPLG